MNHSIITSSVEKLASINSLAKMFDQDSEVFRMPSEKILAEIIDIVRDIIFPYHYGDTPVYADTLKYYIGVRVDRLSRLIREQIQIGLEYECNKCKNACEEADRITEKFIDTLPKLREILTTDVIAAYNGDPAAKNHGEIISCYPVIKALTNYRMAHELLLLGVPLIPRMLTEMAHSETGIDIHPGAQIGEYFTIDHGTGVVIGETCIIGKNVKLYQGVTLGARSFPLDESGNPIKGIPRHPILEDDVIVYSNATILGRITIGKGAVVGGNIWVTQDVPAGTSITQKRADRK
ncbi:MAG: serine acetyltransferase [Bacteroidaceae bacterium]|nr:serine acetyltransferase [Bacteroidaceae bacterium]MBQ2165531.1 serine acetyltransferase [Bacteroidaceae bacterium]MBQ2199534.1 serine acetyltransferase [Bacteroidaceae bacterium]MBQ3627636.1 serine acetyltransferase [Bacteroidaceae bacterium]